MAIASACWGVITSPALAQSRTWSEPVELGGRFIDMAVRPSGEMAVLTSPADEYVAEIGKVGRALRRVSVPVRGEDDPPSVVLGPRQRIAISYSYYDNQAPPIPEGPDEGCCLQVRTAESGPGGRRWRSRTLSHGRFENSLGTPFFAGTHLTVAIEAELSLSVANAPFSGAKPQRLSTRGPTTVLVDPDVPGVPILWGEEPKPGLLHTVEVYRQAVQSADGGYHDRGEILRLSSGDSAPSSLSETTTPDGRHQLLAIERTPAHHHTRVIEVREHEIGQPFPQRPLAQYLRTDELIAIRSTRRGDLLLWVDRTPQDIIRILAAVRPPNGHFGRPTVLYAGSADQIGTSPLVDTDPAGRVVLASPTRDPQGRTLIYNWLLPSVDIGSPDVLTDVIPAALRHDDRGTFVLATMSPDFSRSLLQTARFRQPHSRR
jgi:hypothetical protein